MNQATRTSPARPNPRGALSLSLLTTLLLPLACQTGHPPPPTTQPTPHLTGLSPPTPLPSVRATVTPPLGWTPAPLKTAPNHTHQVWLSPTGHTAFGVIHFSLPLPLSANFILPFYMRAWKQDQGQATLLTKTPDPSLPGLRFVAEGGLYKTWSNLITSGTEGWSIYAGVLRDQPVSQPEFDLATAARDHTRVGLPRD